jgi:hypothetical protein
MWNERETQDCRACVAIVGLPMCTKKEMRTEAEMEANGIHLL